jgi:hypothetical protein
MEGHHENRTCTAVLTGDSSTIADPCLTPIKLDVTLLADV